MTTQSAKPQKVRTPGLRHSHAGLSDDAFFKHVDDCGGWPVGYLFVGFAHSDEREAAFTMTPENHGWWTTIYSADDYYTWKLSAQGLQRIADAVHEAMRLPRVSAVGLSVRSSRGYPLPKKAPEATS